MQDLPDDFYIDDGEMECSDALEEQMENVEESINNYPGFQFNSMAIKKAMEEQFSAIKKTGVQNKIVKIHRDIAFYYNSLNICLGKQGSGKTTLLFRELIKLDNLPDQGNYCAIIYVTNGNNDDETFTHLMPLIKNIPVKLVSFEDILPMLEQYFATRDPDDKKHLFVILEDATFLLVKDNSQWCTMMTQLRHYRMTIWLNLHVWRSITNQIKSQVTCAFVAPGYSIQQMQIIYRQSSITNLTSPQFVMFYQSLRKSQHEWLYIDNIDGSAKKLI